MLVVVGGLTSVSPVMEGSRMEMEVLGCLAQTGGGVIHAIARGGGSVALLW